VIVEDDVAKKLEWVPGKIKYVKSRYNQVVSFTIFVSLNAGRIEPLTSQVTVYACV
jgi:hypothetical protein